MRIVQLQTSDRGRRLGVINGDKILDVTEIDGTPTVRSTYEAFQFANERGGSLSDFRREPKRRRAGSTTSSCSPPNRMATSRSCCRRSIIPIRITLSSPARG